MSKNSCKLNYATDFRSVSFFSKAVSVCDKRRIRTHYLLYTRNVVMAVLVNVLAATIVLALVAISQSAVKVITLKTFCSVLIYTDIFYDN